MPWYKYAEKTVTVKDGQTVAATDPSYDTDDFSTVLCLPAGEYDCYYNLSDEGAWGVRVAHCALLQKGRNVSSLDKGVMTYAGSVDVDAGLAGFFVDKPDYSRCEWAGICESIEKTDAEWKEITGHSCRKAYHTPEGFFTCTGLGDGTYPVYYVKDFDDRIIGAKLYFLNGSHKGKNL